MYFYSIFLNHTIPYLGIPEILKISMTSRKNNKFISEFINNHFINANAFNLTQDDIMFIPKFVEYLFDCLRIKECEHLNKLVKQVTQKHKFIYRFYKNPLILVNEDKEAHYLKLTHYARYMKFAMEHNPLLFQFGKKEFRFQDFWGRKALDADIRNYPYVSHRLRTNEYYAKRAVECNGLLLKHAIKLRNNKEICLIALKQNIQSLEYIGRCVRLDKEFLKELFCQNQKYWFNRFKKDDFFKENMSKLASDFPNEISKYINHMSESMCFPEFISNEIEQFFEDELKYVMMRRWHWEWLVKTKRVSNSLFDFF
jgi:hypothetical protein